MQILPTDTALPHDVRLAIYGAARLAGAQNSRANTDKGELWVRIDGSSRVTPEDIHNAIRAAGIDAHFAKQGVKST
jgi:hypothetical protein